MTGPAFSVGLKLFLSKDEDLILNEFSDYEACSDINSDDTLNVLDIVLLVNLILGTSF